MLLYSFSFDSWWVPDDFEKYQHDLFDGGRCSGWELEELVFKAIQSDSTAGHHATWQEGGHDDQADIRVRVNGEVYPLQIKSGKIKQIKSGSEKAPHLVLSGHRLGRFNGDFEGMTEYLNEDRANFYLYLIAKLMMILVGTISTKLYT